MERFFIDKTPPLVAVHDGKLIEPFSIYYNEKYNLVIIHSIISTPGAEWQIADAIVALCNELKAKEIISLEGIGSSIEKNESRIFYYTNSKKSEASS